MSVWNKHCRTLWLLCSTMASFVRTLVSPFFKAIARAENSEADKLANAALDNSIGQVRHFPIHGVVFAATLHSDGATRGNPGSVFTVELRALGGRSSYTHGIVD